MSAPAPEKWSKARAPKPRLVGTAPLDLSELRVDPGIQQRVGLDPETVETYAATLRDGGPLPAVLAFEDEDPANGCWLADGFHRESAHRLAGVDEILVELRTGGRRAALRAALGANDTHGLRRTRADKRRAVTTALTDTEWSALSDREIGGLTRTSHTFVANVRRELAPAEEGGNVATPEPPKREGWFPAPDRASTDLPLLADPPTAAPHSVDEPRAAPLEPELAGHLVARGEDLEDGDTDEGLIVVAPGAAPPALATTPRPIDGDSWSTPDDIIERVQAAFGGTIDLDPATNEAAQHRIGATTYYTAERDGLAYTWHGQVWLNPPYSHPLVEQFTSKLLVEFDNGNVTEAIVLLNAATDTRWMQALLRPGTLICLVCGRIQFVDEDNEPGTSPRHAQVILYFGGRAGAFREAFGDLGTIVTVTG